MSMIKRWLDDEVERIAEENKKTWDDVMDFAAELDFDLELVEKTLKQQQK